jgi:hypothetical protein
MKSSRVTLPPLRPRVVRERHEGRQREYPRPYAELAKLAQTGENLQYEFRSTFLETSRQQSQLSNEIAVVKSALKIPSLTTPHEVYLSSDFFRERANGVNTRMRTGLRQRTNAGGTGGDTGSTAAGSRVSAEK